MSLFQQGNELQHTSVSAASQLVDSFGRKITYLRLSVTDRCNLHCRYCMPEGPPQWFETETLLADDELVRITRAAVSLGVHKVRITGGEPLVRTGLPSLVSQLREIIGLRELAMTTNGTLLEHYASALKTAGLERLNISLDSLRAERFARITGSNTLSQVWRGIEKALEVGFAPIKINVVVIKGVNDDEVVDFARLTHTYPFHIRFIEYMPIGVNREPWDRTKVVPAGEIKARIAAELPLERATPDDRGGEGPERTYILCESKGCIGFISPVSEEFCAHCNRLRVTSDGKLRGCLTRTGEIDLRAALRAGASDEELRQLILEAARRKPEKHAINGDDFAYDDFYTMNRLGG